MNTPRQRARSLGLALPGTPGPWNAITDVAGVEVGYCTMIAGETVRTGVTAILPRGRAAAHIPCHAGAFSFNGNGEMTGLAWIEEAGELQTPLALTNTASCGTARDAIWSWLVKHRIGQSQDWGLPVAAETYDGDLHDINGFHVKPEHVHAALDGARSGAIALGNVGGGTGMITYDFKGGSGSSSRCVAIEGRRYTVGIFVQSNFGRREDLMVLGVPVGQHLTGDKLRGADTGSIIAIVATDAPLMPHQLKRLARRVPLGMARTGTIGSNSSGDIFLAFSTANGAALASPLQHRQIESLAVDITPLFAAVVEAAEEAILDAMLCSETMTGLNGRRAIALPVADLLALLQHYGRR